jgi:hypothetical protein
MTTESRAPPRVRTDPTRSAAARLSTIQRRQARAFKVANR